MEMALNVGSILEKQPSIVGLVLTILIVGVTLLLKWHKETTEGGKVKNDIHLAQIDILMNQIRLLSEELERTRRQLAELQGQNLQLISQLGESNRQIGELEAALVFHTTDDRAGLMNNQTINRGLI